MAEALKEQLRDVLAKQHMRVMDLFRKWDRDGDARIGIKELRRAVLASVMTCRKKLSAHCLIQWILMAAGRSITRR